MKQINLLFASLALTCFTMYPAVTLADDLDDLEVTMEVLDDESDFAETISSIRGPENADIEFGDSDDAEAEEREDGEGVSDDHDGSDDEGGSGDAIPDRLPGDLPSRRIRRHHGLDAEA